MIDRRCIFWKHILLGLSATTHLPHDVFKAPFDEITSLWGDEKQAKLAFNAMFGYWAIYDNMFYKTFTTCNPQDVATFGEPFLIHRVVGPWVFCEGLPGIGEGMPVHKDYVYATKQLTTRSMRPIHQITLDIEHLRLAQAICLARQFCELRQICYTRVDAIYFQPAKCQANAAKKAFEEITYDKLHEIHFKV